MTRPTHRTPGGHAYLEIQQLARAERRTTQELLVWYVHERFLYRVSTSLYRERLILKGGMLLAALGTRRATQDVDVLARGIDNDHATIAALVREISGTDAGDGVRYDTEQLTTTAIREDAVYEGVRVTMPARVDRANVVFRLDVNVGDPVTPAPLDVEYPSLFGAPFPLRGYPLATVLAEKIVTLMQRGETTTRERDVADIVLLTRRHHLDPDELVAAITATAAHRGVTVRGVRRSIGGLGTLRQDSWEAFLRRAELGSALPASYHAALDEVCALVDSLMPST